MTEIPKAAKTALLKIHQELLAAFADNYHMIDASQYAPWGEVVLNASLMLDRAYRVPSTTDAVGVTVSEVEPVAWRGTAIPMECPLPPVGANGAPNAYEIDPGAGSAMDRVQREWPAPSVIENLRLRDGRITPLYASPTTSPHAPEGVRDDVLATKLDQWIDDHRKAVFDGAGELHSEEMQSAKLWLDNFAAAIRALKGNRT